MPLRHSGAFAQAAPLGAPQRSSAMVHRPVWQIASMGGGPHILPLVRPQVLLLGSQVAARQTRVPLAIVHMPLIGATDGSGWPLAVLGVQVPLLHHWVEAQSASVEQVLLHAPVLVLQMGPPAWPRQSPLVTHLPHEPSPAQYGLAGLG